MKKDANLGTAQGRKRRFLPLVIIATCFAIAVGASIILVGNRGRTPLAEESKENEEAAWTLTPQEVEDVTAAVRERANERIRSIKTIGDGTVLVFVSDGLGGREIRVQKVDGHWRVVGETMFFAFHAPVSGSR